MDAAGSDVRFGRHNLAIVADGTTKVHLGTRTETERDVLLVKSQ